MALATHFAGYVRTKKKHHLQVYVGECFGEPAAILRVWYIDESFIKCTIAIGPDEAALTDHDRGIRFVDLRDPTSCDQIITWMVLVGVAPKRSKWRDPT